MRVYDRVGIWVELDVEFTITEDTDLGRSFSYIKVPTIFL